MIPHIETRHIHLFDAILNNDIEMVQCLFQLGVEVNFFSDDYDSFPLMSATDVYMTQYLIEKGADLNQTCPYGYTAMIAAAGLSRKVGFGDKVIYLIERGADYTVRTTDGMTAFDAAKEQGDIDLLDKMNSAIMRRSNNNRRISHESPERRTMTRHDDTDDDME